MVSPIHGPTEGELGLYCRTFMGRLNIGEGRNHLGSDGGCHHTKYGGPKQPSSKGIPITASTVSIRTALLEYNDDMVSFNAS